MERADSVGDVLAKTEISKMGVAIGSVARVDLVRGGELARRTIARYILNWIASDRAIGCQPSGGDVDPIPCTLRFIIGFLPSLGARNATPSEHIMAAGAVLVFTARLMRQQPYGTLAF